MKHAPKSYYTKSSGYLSQKYSGSIPTKDGFARDRANIQSDWVAVGKDIRISMDKIKHTTNNAQKDPE